MSDPAAMGIQDALLSPSLRDDFPILKRRLRGDKALVYLDSAATSLKPQSVIDAITHVLDSATANVHRAGHQLADEATELYEGARRKVAFFIGAETHEVAFVRNATEGLNFVARGWPERGRVLTFLGDHHSSQLPWGPSREVRSLPIEERAIFPMDALQQELDAGGVAVVALAQVSNVTGAAVDVAEVSRRAHDKGAIVVVDGAQSVPHQPIDVEDLGCDFLAFSSHKMCGPSGMGALWGRADQLEKLAPTLYGGGMVDAVHLAEHTLKAIPHRFEAGTPAIEAAVGFGAATDYLSDIGMEKIQAHEEALVAYALLRIKERFGDAKLIGPRDHTRVGPVSMTLPGLRAQVVARVLADAFGVCVRSGFHCAQPLHESLLVGPTLRASFYLYNTPGEIDVFLEALETLRDS